MEGYSVYEHVFPDGKRYIGISKDPVKRWQSDGSGYRTNAPMYEAIKKYGWKRVKHRIIASGLTREQAREKERELIEEFDTINNGFNTRTGGQVSSTYYSKHVMEMLRTIKRLHLPNTDTLIKGMYECADQEGWAYEVNLVEYIARTQCKGLYEWEHDELLYACAWVYYMENFIVHRDVDIRTIETPLEAKNRYFDSFLRREET